MGCDRGHRLWKGIIRVGFGFVSVGLTVLFGSPFIPRLDRVAGGAQGSWSEKGSNSLWVSGSGFLEGQVKSDRCLRIHFQRVERNPGRECMSLLNSESPDRRGFIPALYQNMTFATVSDAESL